MNNVIPAKFLIDEAMQAGLPHAEYLEWLKAKLEQTGDMYYQRRMELVSKPC